MRHGSRFQGLPRTTGLFPNSAESYLGGLPELGGLTELVIPLLVPLLLGTVTVTVAVEALPEASVD